MPTELEELVEFLHHGNTQIRQIACENLVGYSSNPSIFKKHQLVPITDLKLLVRDYPPIAKNALEILINVSHDEEILENLAKDDAFLETLLKKITDPNYPHAALIAMLLSNLAKSDSLSRLLTLSRTTPPTSTSRSAINQLMDLFVLPTPSTTYDYLAYLLADLSKHKPGRDYLLTPQPYDNIVPLTKLTVFTEHASLVRRQGVANALKNAAFETSRHAMLLEPDEAAGGANLLPYLLLPLSGNEEFSDDEASAMLPELQLLPPDKARESDVEVLKTHLETLLLLCTRREGRESVRSAGTYYVVRECHLHVEDDGVREVGERLVNVLMRGEEEEREEGESEDEDKRIVEVF